MRGDFISTENAVPALECVGEVHYVTSVDLRDDEATSFVL